MCWRSLQLLWIKEVYEVNRMPLMSTTREIFEDGLLDHVYTIKTFLILWCFFTADTQWLALSPHSKKVVSLILGLGSMCVCGVCMFSPCLHGFLQLPSTVQKLKLETQLSVGVYVSTRRL